MYSANGAPPRIPEKLPVAIIDVNMHFMFMQYEGDLHFSTEPPLYVGRRYTYTPSSLLVAGLCFAILVNKTHSEEKVGNFRTLGYSTAPILKHAIPKWPAFVA